jgi:hypothetical protein
MTFQHILCVITLSSLLLSPDCSVEDRAGTILKSYPCDTADAVLDSEGLEVDPEVHEEGRACFRINAEDNRIIALYETGNIDAEDITLIYEASLKTQGVEGRVYLEMWCVFQGKGEFFSRGLNQSLSGSAKWTRAATPFILKTGENPDNVRLNLVIEGKGTVWIDDIKLIKKDR